ncbi:hypothetical protein LCGC14_2203050, partial [marine sediment metagenome]
MKKLFSKKLALLFVFLLATVAVCLTVTIDRRPMPAVWWSGSTRDIAWQWAKEIENILEEDAILFNPTDTVPTASEGRMYYNDTANGMIFYNGSSWVTMGTSSGGDSLDTAYGNGVGITIDNGPVTLTATNAADDVALAIVQSDTGTTKGFTLTNAGTGNTIDIQNAQAGTDIEGTDDTWNIATTGAATFVGMASTSGELTMTTSDVLFDDTYDVAWDTSRDMLIFQDNAVLGIGGAHDAVADVTITWNASNLLVESATEDTGEIQIGATNAIDLVLYANTNTNEVAFNANTGTAEFNGYDVQMLDDDIIAYGDSDEFQTYYDETTTDNLITVATNANDAVQIGDGTTNTDLKLMCSTSGDFVILDASANELFFEDADLKINEGAQIEFSVADDSIDWT